MIEMTLEEDLPAEFRVGTLSINNGDKTNDISKPSSPTDKKDINTDKDPGKLSNNNCQWGTGFLLPLASVPNKITGTIWNSKNKEPATAAPKVDNSIQPSINLNEDANNYFTFREEVVEKAVKDCVEQFLDLESEGPLLASYLLTQINHWDTDKERLVLLTPKSLVVAKYDFIALKRLGCKKLSLEEVDLVILGDLIYPSGSLIPRINGLADGVSNILENCLFARWSKNENKQLDNFYQPRDRKMKGVRIIFNKGEPINFKSKWNPFSDDIPFWTLSYHPLYFHKDCTDESLRTLYNLESFNEKLCIALSDLKKNNENCIIQHHNILLDNYVGLGSIIHNRNSLGFFKVRGKFSF